MSHYLHRCATLLCALAVGCGGVDEPAAPTSDELAAASPPALDSDGAGRLVVTSFGRDGEPIDERALQVTEVTPPSPLLPAAPAPASVATLSDELRARLQTTSPLRGQDLLAVTIVMRDPQPAAALPAVDPLLPRAGAVNQARLRARLAAFEGLRAHRYSLYAPIIRQIEDAGGALQERSVSCKCFSAAVPEALLPALQQRADVAHIDVTESSRPTPPPVDGNPNNDIADAKARINYGNFSAFSGSNGQWLALLDTGVRVLHSSLSSVNWIEWSDCVNGGTNCDQSANPGYNADDNFWNHGTSTASILVGNANLGNDHKGLLESQFGSLKVYDGNGLHLLATLRAFDLAVRSGYDVIVAEMQDDNLDSDSPIASAASDAFDHGVSVVAANGNTFPPGVCPVDPMTGLGQAGVVGGPAHAKKVIGVGTYDINSSSNAPVNSTCLGPTADGRVKPDIQLPTNTEAASAAGTTATRTFSGTSGATPYAGAAAMLLRNFYFSQGWSTNPANIYAALIANGSGSVVGPVSARAGGGPLKLRTRSCASWYNGWHDISNGQTLEIPFDVGLGTQEIAVAIWWPEGNDYHNRVGLSLVSPTSVSWGSWNPTNIWQRIIVTTSQAGTWKVRLDGLSVPRGPQRVWMLLHSRVPDCSLPG